MRYEQMIQYAVEDTRPQEPLNSEPFHRYIFDDGSVWTEFHRSETGYLLRFPDLADFSVSGDGKTVVAHPVSGTDDATVEHLYINQLVPLALSRQGLPAFHASVVAIQDIAVAFLGKTGAGKSTLATSFALEGASFLTDDGLMVEKYDDGYLALPSHASVRLWDDSAAALVSHVQDRASPISYSDKTRLLAGEALSYCAEPLPLMAAFLLGDEEPADVKISALDGGDRYKAWLENSFLLDIEDKALLAAHFDWTHQVSDAVPTYRLDYVRDFCMLPQVRRAIRARVTGA